MRADAILSAQAMVTTSKSLESDPTMVQGLMPIDQVRHQVAHPLRRTLQRDLASVSYTHLTLPTSDLV